MTAINFIAGRRKEIFQWQHHPGNPIFPVVPGTWMEDQTANPDLLCIGDTYFLYFRAQQGGHDRIGVATIPVNQFDGVTWQIHPESPIIDVGPPGSFDENHVLDPGTVYVDGTIYLYYSAVNPRYPRSVGLATSNDGIHFRKHPECPLLLRSAPEPVYRDGRFYLFYGRHRKSGGEEICLATSDDGVHFTEYAGNPVVGIGPPGAWDSHCVETPRIFFENGLYYLLYCGSDRHDDYPFHAGLAVSGDLFHWRKYEGNPIFSRGQEDEWDEGAIWFATVEKIKDVYCLWYEGYGGGSARNQPYGSYLKEGRSQIGLATMKAPYFYIKSERKIADS